MWFLKSPGTRLVAIGLFLLAELGLELGLGARAVASVNAKPSAFEFPIVGLRFNPALKVIVNAETRGGGFILSGHSGDVEFVIKGTPFPSALAAAQMAKVELANIKNLYSPRKTPYAGQISEFVVCDKTFLPVANSLSVQAHVVPTLMAGVNARKLFGACTPDQIAYWAEYFTFYDRPGSREIDVRLYKKLNNPNPANVRTLNKSLHAFAERLLVENR